MSIEKRPITGQKNKFKFRARFYIGGRKKVTSPWFHRRSEAIAWHDDQVAASSNNPKIGGEDAGPRAETEGLAAHVPADNTTSGKRVIVASIVDAFAEYAKTFANKSLHHRDESLRTILAIIESYRLNVVTDYTALVLEQYTRNAKVSACTVSRRVGILKHFGSFLKRAGYLKTDPTAEVEKPAPKNSYDRWALSEQEVAAVFDALKAYEPDIYPVCYFMVKTGLRKREACTLTWQNIDLERGAVAVFDKPDIVIRGEPFRCKRGSSRVVPLSPSLIEFLRSLPRDWAYLLHDMNVDMFYNNLSRAFKKALFKAKVPNAKRITPYQMRHTWISTALSNGLDTRT